MNAVPLPAPTVCKFCGSDVDQESEMCAELCCHRTGCGRSVYHQACIEQHLRKLGFPPDRMCGFPCPWGHGKFDNDKDACKGKIDSTRRIVVKNKKKKAAACNPLPMPAYVKPAPNLPKPKPQQTAAAAVAAAAARLAAANRPTPVRAGVVPGADGNNSSNAPSLAQQRDLKAAALQQLALGGGRPKGAGGKPQAGVAEPSPGAAAAARLGATAPVEGSAAARAKKGKGAAAAQETYIPGMEPAEPKPRAKPAAQPARQFNLHEDFPALVDKQAHANGNGLDGQAAVGLGGAWSINALEPNHANGFITDLERYNLLIGNDSSSNGDGSQDPGADGGHDGGAYDKLIASIPDDQLYQALVYGLEAAGLPPELAGYLQQVRDVLNNDPALLESFYVAGANALTPEQQAEADQAAYLAAEQVVLEAELAKAASAGQLEDASHAAAVYEAPPQYNQGAMPVLPALAPHIMVSVQAAAVPALAPAVNVFAPQAKALETLVFVPPAGAMGLPPPSKAAEMTDAAEEDVDVDDLINLCLN